VPLAAEPPWFKALGAYGGERVLGCLGTRRHVLDANPVTCPGFGSNFGSNLSEPEPIRERQTPIKPGYMALPERQRRVRAQYRPSRFALYGSSIRSF
jgi:hypothetical protein